MPIYDMFDSMKKEKEEPSFQTGDFEKEEDLLHSKVEESAVLSKDRLFSCIAARLFFLVLLFADLVWMLYAALLFVANVALWLLTLSRVSFFKKGAFSFYLTLKRSLICAVSLFIALFSPSFGIMIACTYFLMYDKTGIEEVVPSSLRAQFSEFFSQP